MGASLKILRKYAGHYKPEKNERVGGDIWSNTLTFHIPITPCSATSMPTSQNRNSLHRFIQFTEWVRILIGTLKGSLGLHKSLKSNRILIQFIVILNHNCHANANIVIVVSAGTQVMLLFGSFRVFNNSLYCPSCRQNCWKPLPAQCKVSWFGKSGMLWKDVEPITGHLVAQMDLTSGFCTVLYWHYVAANATKNYIQSANSSTKHSFIWSRISNEIITGIYPQILRQRKHGLELINP